MKTRTLLKVEGKYPDILTMESAVRGLHYLYEASPSQILVAPSGKALAYIGTEPVLRLSAEEARTMAREILELLEVNGG